MRALLYTLGCGPFSWERDLKSIWSLLIYRHSRNKLDKPYKRLQSQGHVKKKKKAYRCCSKFNNCCLLSCRNSSTLNFCLLPTHCDLASRWRSRSSKRGRGWPTVTLGGVVYIRAMEVPSTSSFADPTKGNRYKNERCTLKPSFQWGGFMLILVPEGQTCALRKLVPSTTGTRPPTTKK